MRLSRLKRPKALWFQIQNPFGTPTKTHQRIRPMSDRRRRVMDEYRKEREIFLLEHPFCEMPGCNSPIRDLHHSRGRIGILLLLKQFWRAICRSHHDWIKDHPIEARELGMLCQAGEWNSPPTTPDP